MASYATDPRRAIMVNGAAYARQMSRKTEPHTTLPTAILSGICIACFAVGVLLFAAGVSWLH